MKFLSNDFFHPGRQKILFARWEGGKGFEAYFLVILPWEFIKCEFSKESLDPL